MLLIDIRNVSHWYGPHQVLHHVSVQLPPGRIGLLGPNGAGKSTLLRISLGLLTPKQGSGAILGRSLTSGAALRQLVGYMPEADALIPGMRGADYVGLAGELCGLPRKQALRRAHELLTYLELGDARYRRLEEYSTGMKQRLKLAQALVHDPPVLLLDEPTSGMDPPGRSRMLSLLKTLNEEHGKSILLSTHLMADVEEVCDSVIILHTGRVVCQGRVEDLCQRREDRFSLEIDGEVEAYCQELQTEGVEILARNGRGSLRVRVPQDWTTRAFFVLADHHGATVRGLKHDDEDMDELFHRMVLEELQGSDRTPRTESVSDRPSLGSSNVSASCQDALEDNPATGFTISAA